MVSRNLERLVKNFWHASGVTLIESIVVVANELKAGIFPLSLIYPDLNWERRALSR